MKSPIKILSILAIGGFLAGTAFAGPSEVTNRFTLPSQSTSSVSIALFRSSNGLTPTSASNCSMVTEHSKLIPSGNPKSPGLTKVVTGYTYPGCVGTSTGAMNCKGSTTSCATMLQGS